MIWRKKFIPYRNESSIIRRCAAGKQEAVYVALGMMKNVVFVAGGAGEYVRIVPYR